MVVSADISAKKTSSVAKVVNQQHKSNNNIESVKALEIYQGSV